MYSAQATYDGITYTIAGDDFGTFTANMYEVGGLFGLKAACDEVTGKVAESAVEPIAAKPEPETPEPPVDKGDELVDLILNAPDERALQALWRAHRDRWNGDYNKLAAKRKTELEKASKRK